MFLLFNYICLEIVVLGTGEKILRLDPEIHSYLKKRNILLEVQDTVSFDVQLHLLKYKSFTIITLNLDQQNIQSGFMKKW